MKIKARKPWKITRRGNYSTSWLTVSAVGLAACGAAGGQLGATAFAAPIPRTVTLPQDAPTFRFDIEPGSLGEVLAAFEKATGLTVAFGRTGMQALPSPGVRGQFTADRALQQIIAGNGIRARYTAAQAITLDMETLTTSIEVTTQAPALAASSPRYTEPLREVPQTIEVIPSVVLEQQGAVTLNDAMRNVPGITIQAGEGGGASNTAGDMFNMRGFNASNNLFVDGVRDDGLVSRNVYNLEAVEVFLGPTGTDVGRGTASGYVNMQTKTPGAMPAYSGTVAYESSDQKRGTIDLNQPLSQSSTGWLGRAAARLNALWQQGGVPGRDVAKVKNRSIAPSLSFGLGTPTRATLSSQFTRQNNSPDYGVPTAAWLNDSLNPAVPQAALPVRLTNYYGTPDFDFDRASQNSYTVRVEHDLHDRMTLRHQTRYNQTHRNAIVTALGAFAPATETVAPLRQGNERENRIVSNQSNAIARFSTAGLQHALSTGIEHTYEDQFAWTIGGVGTRSAVDIYNPNPNDSIAGYAPARTGALTKGWTNTAGVFAFDTVDIGSKLQLSGGIRWEYFHTNFRALNSAGAATTDQKAGGGLFSGKAGLLYRITDTGNVYVSYGTSLTPPGTANFTLSAQANNQNNPNVEPQLSRNYEVGSKWDFFRNRLLVTAAAFHTRNENVIFTVDATAIPPIFNQDDGQLVRGVSFGATGRITDRLHVLANFSALDSERQSQNPAQNGKLLQLTAPYSGSFWATYALPRGITAGGGVAYTDRVWVNATNTIFVPGYAVLDAVFDYPVNENLTLRLNVNNLTDKSYVRSVNNNGNRFNPGSPRSVMISSAFRF